MVCSRVNFTFTFILPPHDWFHTLRNAGRTSKNRTVLSSTARSHNPLQLQRAWPPVTGWKARWNDEIRRRWSVCWVLCASRKCCTCYTCIHIQWLVELNSHRHKQCGFLNKLPQLPFNDADLDKYCRLLSRLLTVSVSTEERIMMQHKTVRRIKFIWIRNHLGCERQCASNSLP
jgi:hypothetical protein